ncbi:tyrosine-type recombinase/integrase [Nannocystaceae bacterium ST9]
MTDGLGSISKGQRIMSFTIRPFRSGGWEIDIVLTLPNGDRIRERRKAPVERKADAKKWGQERERYILQHGRRSRRGKGRPEFEEPIPTFAEFVPRYLNEHVKANREKPSTHHAKCLICTNHLIPAFGPLQLQAITAEDIQRLKLKLADRSPKTLNNVLSVFNSVLKVAHQWGVIAAIPVHAKWVKTTVPSMAFYDFDEYERLRETARRIGPCHELLILLAGDAGLRCGELRALRWSSINFEHGLLTVEWAYSLDQVLAPKSDKIRIVPMTARLREALQKHHETQDPEHVNVLTTEKGKPPSAAMIRSWLNRAQREAKLAEKGPHTLRHTFCSHLAMTGAHVMEIKALAGHSELETTQRYMHLSPQTLRRAIDRLNDPGHNSKPNERALYDDHK